MLTYASAQQQFVIRASNNAVTEPVGGSWLAAYAIYLGATEPNGTWLQTICELTGITAPLNGSWIQALANHYGITQPISGNYWIDLAEATFGPPLPIADFTSNITTVPENDSVDFEDTSNPNGSPITAWLWTFAGGSPATSTQQNPTVTYATPGTYQVSLQVTNANGSNTKTVPGYIIVSNSAIVADFTANDTTPVEGQTVNFTDTSYGDTATAWSWTFEGGTPATSSAQNPSVVYNTAGDYDVTLQVFDESGSNTKNVPNYISVSAAPSVGFLINTWDLDTGYNILEPTGIQTNKNLMLFRL